MHLFHSIYRGSHILAIVTLLFVVASMTFFSNTMARRLAKDEHDKMELWAEAYRVIASVDAGNEAQTMALKVISNNETIPLIITDEDGNINSHNNIKLPKNGQDAFLEAKLDEFKHHEAHPPLMVSFEVGGGMYTQYIYYGPSILLKRLSFFPIWQVGIIAFFMLMAYFVMDIARRSEENRVWVGLSKETAHQLGTPISSLLAWVDLMRSGHQSDEMVDEMQKDVTRLQKVASRFSKIGSKPTLEMYNLSEVLDDAVNYMSARITKKVRLERQFKRDRFIPVMLNQELFEWVVENLIKNAIDAMRGGGRITIRLQEDDKQVSIEVEDQGKGIPKNRFKEIFNPGVSSKQRGWGLGLSFAKRIVKDYHGGKIFVKKSELNVGTTFCIIIPKCTVSK